VSDAHTPEAEDLYERVLSTTGLRGSADIVARTIECIVEDCELSIVDLRHAGWQSVDDRALIELEVEDDGQPPRTIPVWTVGPGAVGLPALTMDD
jgi:hypothetical protein